MPVLVGIAGGSGSGKTTLAGRLLELTSAVPAARVRQDAYYKDRPDLTYDERCAINYDHPDSLDNALLLAHLGQLLSGGSVEVPRYDFSRHRREPMTDPLGPAELIILEGILVLADPELRSLMGLTVFVDTAADVRLARRLDRDVRERGRTRDSVMRQYAATVWPMHQLFVEPSKRYADLVVPEGGLNEASVRSVSELIHRTLIERPAGARGKDGR